MNKILIVDDDPFFRSLVKVVLRKEGFAVYEADDGLDALSKLKVLKADLAILDVMMPNMDGFELCRQLRESYDIPLLMLTAKGETSQKVKGFQLGTDDYLVKPFEPMELVVRVKALLRRYQIIASQNVQIGKLIMNQKNYEVTAGDEKFTLPLKEFELLYKLAGQPGRTFSRDKLMIYGVTILQAMSGHWMCMLTVYGSVFRRSHSTSELQRSVGWDIAWIQIYE